MPLDKSMRLLKNKWDAGRNWPKHLEWVEITNIRGWTGQRVDFKFPITAIVGENGSGKSTILQSAASVYLDADNPRYASEFFPDTPFENITTASIKFSYKQGNDTEVKAVRKPSDRWRGNPERPTRNVIYIDLTRIQPVAARLGYQKLLRGGVNEIPHSLFDRDKLSRISNIMGKNYSTAGISVTSIDGNRQVPILENGGAKYSGFHQGAGEITATELIARDLPKYSIVLIDEVESSLHPRAQRRLIRDLAIIAREKELQIILTTHSPYILDELPQEARIYLMEGVSGKTVVTGVSPEFAMSRMDEENHPECDIYVEDDTAKILVEEILTKAERDLLHRCQVVTFGSAQVGISLGMMCSQGRFPRPSVVFLDGDQETRAGCSILPGGDNPEAIVFGFLKEKNWGNVANRIGREISETIDALERAMLVNDHHRWLSTAANSLTLGTDTLWRAMSAVWASFDENQIECEKIADTVRAALDG